MIRSFHYAAFHALAEDGERPRGLAERRRRAERAERWHRSMAAAFQGAYMRASAGASYLPRRDDELRALLTVCLLEKALYELAYEIDNRPAWAGLPLRGIHDLLDALQGG
jgi:predicted trehalose synthase